jgi:hypothetical protein
MLARDPIKRLVERTHQPIEKLFDFRRADDKRRRQRHHVAEDRAHDQAFFLGETDGSSTDSVLGVEGALALLVGHQLQTAYESQSTRFADQRMAAERFEPRLEQGRPPRGFFNDAVALIDLDRLEGDGGGNRMAAVRKP